MFCCTFYSYKGGVGRTLALANVAIELASQGKKVLVVDFDLEAPGLGTLPPFLPSRARPGVIDFVFDFIQNNVVPDAREYICSCAIESVDAEFYVDIMPAGLGQSGYSHAYSSIEWGALYKEKDGFLLMEDLRAQWSDIGYDYVFLDSRTGHTDIGGICTRQLPDAVAVVFFPNLQNLEGLVQTVPEIRESKAREFPVQLVFVASRVPKLDDEHGVLKKLLGNFQSSLGYKSEELVVLEQYDSLSLLDQEIFVLSRPKSGLAKQFRDLASHISRLNVEDADGAAAYLQNLLADVLGRETQIGNLSSEGSEVSRERLERIVEAHPDDAYILYQLARIRYELRELIEASILLDKAIQRGCQTSVSKGVPKGFEIVLHRFRLRLASELDLPNAIEESSRTILNSPISNDNAILDAIGAVANISPELIPPLEKLSALDHAKPEMLMSVARRLSWSPATIEVSAEIIERMLERKPYVEEISNADVSDIQLPLISTGRFNLACRVFENLSPKIGLRLDVLFNSAMAKWGRDGEPDLEMFARVLEKFKEGPQENVTANHSQCRALVEGLLGNPEKMEVYLHRASVDAERARHLEFSCWDFTNVPLNTFLDHLEAIREFILEDGQPPAFLSASARNRNGHPVEM